MQRLTLRAAEDSRFLARIVERDGFAFVLDYGDPEMIADATDRINRGFSVLVSGHLEHVAPGAADLMPRLAAFYEADGLLVSLETPMTHMPGRVFDDPDATRLKRPASDVQTVLLERDDETDLVTLESLSLDAARVADAPPARRLLWNPGPLEPLPMAERPDEEEVTELVPEEMRRRALSGDEATERHSVAGALAAAALAELEAEDEA
ncbi:MAG: hypothetical protein KC656_21590 [Myxococcales bacterium]|nr:hypothetical protein [Myxococcales bacterium]MCB9672371.1 hypothetical protein [Alphaproteobacteria bacterium]